MATTEPTRAPSQAATATTATSAQVTASERRALTRAVELAQATSTHTSPNPRVGCVLLDRDGNTIAEGYHLGPGTPHAEAAALQQAGSSAAGCTAVVSLEPCNHFGRTPPCSQALIDADVHRVVFAVSDPTSQARGGAAHLRAHGVDVVADADPALGAAADRNWLLAQQLHRPVVIWKTATSLDGRIAAADGTSKWITCAEARRQVHVLRSQVDAVLTSTETALRDQAQLTVRLSSNPAAHQPQRVVMGHRQLDAGHPLADAMHLHTHDPKEALAILWQREVRTVLLEAGGTLASAWLAAGVVDDIVWFTAPILLGDGGTPVVHGGPTTLADAHRWQLVSTRTVGTAAATELRLDLSQHLPPLSPQW